MTQPSMPTTNVVELNFEERCRLVELSEVGEPTRADALRAALVTSMTLDDIPEPDPLLDGLIFCDSLAWLYGAPGCCKSFVAIDIAGCVATGETWQGFRVRLRGPVLYLVAEGVTGVKRRVRAWEKAMGVRMDDVHFLPVAVQASNASEWSALIEVVAEIKPVLIIVDTQARVSVGMEENSATEMGQLVHRLEALRTACRACVLTIHHTGRNGEHMRGSIAMDGAATTLIKVAKAEDIVSLECSKQKDAPEFDAFRLRLTPYAESAVLSPIQGFSPSSVDSPAVQRLTSSWWDSFETDWVGAKTVIEATESSRNTFFRHVKALERALMVEAKGDGPSKRFRLLRNPRVPSVPHESHRPDGTQDIESRQSHSPTTLGVGLMGLSGSPAEGLEGDDDEDGAP